ncbi:hypothetical protein Tco_1125534 [Tanacetum coccineum]|uniref:Uncharacterized protein n=1 Tax=Tanacetum coccineum TaxID=301880 RepID=A0ABQ5JDG6_9ASTR
MVKLSVDLNELKDSSKTDKAAQNDKNIGILASCRTPKSLTWKSTMAGGLHQHLVGLDYGLYGLKVDADVLEMANSVEAPIVIECGEDPFEKLDDILGEYAHIGKQITGNEITRNESIGNEINGKQMVVHVGNSSTVDDVLELEMLFEIEGVGPVGKYKEVKVDADNESE